MIIFNICHIQPPLDMKFDKINGKSVPKAECDVIKDARCESFKNIISQEMTVSNINAVSIDLSEMIFAYLSCKCNF